MTLLMAFPGMEKLGQSIADLLAVDLAQVDIHRFPDGESLVTLPGELAGLDVAFVATLRHPDALALPLRFASLTAREMGAKSVGLVAPYLAYMRQDHRFAPGQAVSGPLFARFIEESFDWLVTADPHLHRIPTLDAIFTIPVRRAATARLLADWISAHVTNPVLLGPDSESAQWVAEVAELAGCPFEVLDKIRSGDRRVEMSTPLNGAFQSSTPVIVDDIASSGRTMIEAIRQLTAMGSAPPICLVIHAVFAANAYEDMLASGAARVISTDSIPHPSNAISLGPLLATEMRSLMHPVKRSP
ncbi:ribose-phosphate diphosphokinase [Tsuneonella sp. HG249]